MCMDARMERLPEGRGERSSEPTIVGLFVWSYLPATPACLPSGVLPTACLPRGLLADAARLALLVTPAGGAGCSSCLACRQRRLALVFLLHKARQRAVRYDLLRVHHLAVIAPVDLTVLSCCRRRADYCSPARRPAMKSFSRRVDRATLPEKHATAHYRPPPQRYCQATPAASKSVPVRVDTPVLAYSLTE
jgi:hypothetical protein